MIKDSLSWKQDFQTRVKYLPSTEKKNPKDYMYMCMYVYMYMY